MTIQCNVAYHQNGWLGTRFANHFVLGVKEDIGAHPKNILEKMGDHGLWIVEKFPAKLWEVMKDPKVVTVALTAFALLATSFAFYPGITYMTVKSALAVLPQIPLWAVRFSAYISTVGLILATAMRAEGRFLNKDLMDKFYH